MWERECYTILTKAATKAAATTIAAITTTPARTIAVITTTPARTTAVITTTTPAGPTIACITAVMTTLTTTTAITTTACTTAVRTTITPATPTIANLTIAAHTTPLTVTRTTIGTTIPLMTLNQWSRHSLSNFSTLWIREMDQMLLDAWPQVIVKGLAQKLAVLVLAYMTIQLDRKRISIDAWW